MKKLQSELAHSPSTKVRLFYRYMCVRGGSSAGATDAWAPADIQQRVPGTGPEMSLGIKVPICHQKYQDFEFKFHFISKNWVHLESN